uniref:Uncharacterized protein n=1 Tax=Anguilla anguilla TaxID=7936 RepID=A0A0E9QYX3_ANGAN
MLPFAIVVICKLRQSWSIPCFPSINVGSKSALSTSMCH